jgi:hypothetical protein
VFTRILGTILEKLNQYCGPVPGLLTEPVFVESPPVPRGEAEPLRRASHAFATHPTERGKNSARAPLGKDEMGEGGENPMERLVD